MYYPIIVMASLIKKIKKGRPYYYAVESARVNGKPRIVWQKYLGTLDAIVKQREKVRPEVPREAVLFEAGAVAALLGIAQRLGFLEIVDKIVPKRQQGPSVGEYMLLAALNRALAPCSKLGIGDWYEQTILKRLWRYPKSAFSSQRFWDHMDRMSEDVIHSIEKELLFRIKEECKLDSKVLLYDTTNFFTFLATANNRASLPARGNSKAKRHDLRQVGLALLVTREFQIPLLHHVYPGNIPDVTLFPMIAQQLINRYKDLVGNCQEATLVFDKGNVSQVAMERLIVENVHFIAALSANRAPELFTIPKDRFLDIPQFPATKAFTTKEKVWGKTCQVVVVYTESFFTQQLFGLTQNLVKCQRKLAELKQRLRKHQQGKAQGKKPNLKTLQQQVEKILSPQFIKDIVKVKIFEKNSSPDLTYALDHSALRQISNERLGKTILVTDQLDWTPPQIIESYRNLAYIENTFKNMKNHHFLRWQPVFHWTDQKLQVHGFYCVLALLLCNLAHKIIQQAGIHISLPLLLKELSSIRQVALLYSPSSPSKPLITLSRMSPKQKKLAQTLNIQEIMKSR